MAKKALPRKTTIRGQRHLLAYITPGEAELLKAHGGSGELHKGIPSYPAEERDTMGREKEGGGFEGGGGGGGMKDGDGPGKKFDSGYKMTASLAQKQVQAQIDQAKKLQQAQSKKSLVEQVITSIVPGFNINTVQNYAAQFMGNKIKGILSEDPDATVVRDSKTGRITGVRDKYGRLTGRDPNAERPEKDGESAGEAERKRKALLAQQQAAAGDTTTGPSMKKKVIQTELAKETEASRLAGIKLGKRSLLSKASMLGV